MATYFCPQYIVDQSQMRQFDKQFKLRLCFLPAGGLWKSGSSAAPSRAVECSSGLSLVIVRRILWYLKFQDWHYIYHTIHTMKRSLVVHLKSCLFNQKLNHSHFNDFSFFLILNYFKHCIIRNLLTTNLCPCLFFLSFSFIVHFLFVPNLKSDIALLLIFVLSKMLQKHYDYT